MTGIVSAADWPGLELFFFFQAEDGIRDYKVTGVQTCALPIWAEGHDAPALAVRLPARVLDAARHPRLLLPQRVRHDGAVLPALRQRPRRPLPRRSEERRVGKECSSGGDPQISMRISNMTNNWS